MSEKGKKITEYPMIMIFFAMCVCMLAGYIVLPQNDFSDMENRFLQKLPQVSLQALSDGSFMDTFETYTNEQVPLRNMLVRSKAVMVWMTGASENDGIAKGRDSYLFDKTASTSDKAHTNIAAIRNFAKSIERDVYVTVAPTSTWINADRLPNGMPVLDEVSLSNELTQALSPIESAHVVYLYDMLMSHKEEQLYYRTDHHWTTKGAGYAYEQIASDMDLPVHDISEYEKKEASDFYGTHFAKYKGILVPADTIEYYDVPVKGLELQQRTVDNLIDTDKLTGYDKYAAFMYGNDGKEIVRADKGIGRDLIIFKDSYANCLIPYLTMNYDNITVIDLRYFGGKVSDVLAENSDADILMLYNWSFINEDNHFYKLVSK